MIYGSDLRKSSSQRFKTPLRRLGRPGGDSTIGDGVFDVKRYFFVETK